MEYTKIHYENILPIMLGILSQIVIIVTIVRNAIVHKEPLGWLFPDGTSRKEKITLLIAVIVLVIVFLWPT
jgi:hypothetical protein